jgi:hypothetical protein
MHCLSRSCITTQKLKLCNPLEALTLMEGVL